MGVSDRFVRHVCCDGDLCCDCMQVLSGKELEPTWIVRYPELHVLCKGCHAKRYWGKDSDGTKRGGEEKRAAKPQDLPKGDCDCGG